MLLRSWQNSLLTSRVLPPVRVRVIGDSVRVDGLNDNPVQGPESLKVEKETHRDQGRSALTALLLSTFFFFQESIERSLACRSDAIVIDETGSERRHPAAHVVVTFNIVLTRFLKNNRAGAIFNLFLPSFFFAFSSLGFSQISFLPRVRILCV